MNFSKKHYLILCFILIILSATLRIGFVSHESLWGDEVWTIKFIEGNVKEIIDMTANDVHPPGYFLLMHYWNNIFEGSVFSLRFPSLLFGLCSIVMFYLLCKKLKLDALSATTLFSLSLSGLIYSHEARAYTILLLLTIGSWYFLADMIKHHKGYIGYSLFSTLILYIHVFGIVVFTLNNLFILFSFNKKQLFDKKFISSCIIPIGLFGPWLPIFVYQIKNFLPLLLVRLEQKTHGLMSPMLFYVLLTMGVILSIILVLFKLIKRDTFSLIDCYNFMIKYLKKHSTYLTIIWILIFSLGYSFFSQSNPFVRYFIFLIPLIYITMIQILDNNRKLAIALMIFSFLILCLNAYTIDRFDWRNAVEYSIQFESDNTYYGFDKAGSSFILFDYYTTNNISGRMLKFRQGFMTQKNNQMIETYKYYPKENIKKENTYVLILSKLKDKTSEYDVYLEQTHRLKEQKQFKDILIKVFIPV